MNSINFAVSAGFWAAINSEIERLSDEQTKYESKIDDLDIEARQSAVIEQFIVCKEKFKNNYRDFCNALYEIKKQHLAVYDEILKRSDNCFDNGVQTKVTDELCQKFLTEFSSFIENEIQECLFHYEANKHFTVALAPPPPQSHEALSVKKGKVGMKRANCIFLSEVLRRIKNGSQTDEDNCLAFKLPKIANFLKRLVFDHRKLGQTNYNEPSSELSINSCPTEEIQLIDMSARREKAALKSLCKFIRTISKKPGKISLLSPQLTNDIFIKCLHKDLKQLVLVDCHNLNNDSLSLILKHALRIQSLAIQRCQGITAIAGPANFFPFPKYSLMELPHLRRLWVHGCNNITHICLKALALNSIDIYAVPSVEKIEVHHLWARNNFSKVQLDLEPSINFFINDKWQKHYEEIGVEPPFDTSHAVNIFLKYHAFSIINAGGLKKIQALNDYLNRAGKNRILANDFAKEEHANSRDAMKQATRVSLYETFADKYKENVELFDMIREMIDQTKLPPKEFPLETFSMDGKSLLGRSFIEQSQRNEVLEFYELLILFEEAILSFESNCKMAPPSSKEYSDVNKYIRNLLEKIIQKYEVLGKPESFEMEFIDDVCLSIYLQKFNSLDASQSNSPFSASIAMGTFTKKVFELGLTYGTEATRSTLQFLGDSFNDHKGTNAQIAQLIQELVLISGELSSVGGENGVKFYANHPQRAYHSFSSMIDNEVISYDSLDDVPVHELLKVAFEMPDGRCGKVVHICAGTPTKAAKPSPIFECAIRASDRKGIPWRLVSLQKSEGAEGRRVAGLIEGGKRDLTKTLNVQTDTVDGPVFEKGKTLLPDGLSDSSIFFNLNDFASKFGNYVLTDINKYEIGGNGYYLPEKDAHKIIIPAINSTVALFAPTKNTLNDFSEEYSNYIKLPSERKARLFQFTFQLMKNIGIMVEDALKNGKIGDPIRIYIEQCKQDIDRGAVKNVITTLILLLLSGNNLDLNLILEIISPLLGRPQCSQQRSIIMHRLEPLFDLLNSVPLEDLKKAFRDHLKSLGFPDLIVRVDLLTRNRS